jgi:hypothetical protein
MRLYHGTPREMKTVQNATTAMYTVVKSNPASFRTAAATAIRPWAPRRFFTYLLLVCSPSFATLIPSILL